MHLLADASQEQQVEMLHKELVELDKAPAEMNDMVAAWVHGDVEKIGKMDNDELAVKYPAEYKRLVVDRKPALGGDAGWAAEGSGDGDGVCGRGRGAPGGAGQRDQDAGEGWVEGGEAVKPGPRCQVRGSRDWGSRGTQT